MSSGEGAKEDEHIVVARMGHWFNGEPILQCKAVTDNLFLSKYYSVHFVQILLIALCSSACEKWRKVASCGKCLLHTAGHLAGGRKVGSGKIPDLNSAFTIF